MFGKKKTSKSSIEVTKLSSLISDNLEINGDLVFSSGLRIDGRLNGNATHCDESKSLLVLSNTGCIQGNVRSYDAVINGTIIGDVEVEHFLELQAGAKVTGSIRYRQLQMDCGATVDGSLLKMGADDDEGSSNVVEMPQQYSIANNS